jgi:hypothetical protein
MFPVVRYCSLITTRERNRLENEKRATGSRVLTVYLTATLGTFIRTSLTLFPKMDVELQSPRRNRILINFNAYLIRGIVLPEEVGICTLGSNALRLRASLCPEGDFVSLATVMVAVTSVSHDSDRPFQGKPQCGR